MFDSNLYYQDGIYRTPTMVDSLYHNHLIMKEKGLLVCNKKRDDFSIIPSSGVDGALIEHLIPILTFLDGFNF